MAPPQGHMLYIGLYREKHEKIFLSETTRPRAMIFGMKHNLVVFYPFCSNYTPGAKNGPNPGGHMLHIGFTIGRKLKLNLLVWNHKA